MTETPISQEIQEMYEELTMLRDDLESLEIEFENDPYTPSIERAIRRTQGEIAYIKQQIAYLEQELKGD